MNAEETLEILLQVRSLIETLETWIQGMFAVRADGTPCSPNSPDARRFCLEAALARTTGSFQLQEPHLAILRASQTTSLIELNDDHEHCEVLRAIDIAIASCLGRLGVGFLVMLPNKRSAEIKATDKESSLSYPVLTPAECRTRLPSHSVSIPRITFSSLLSEPASLRRWLA